MTSTKCSSTAFFCAVLFGCALFCGISSADEISVRQFLAKSETTEYLQQDDFRIERVTNPREIPAGSMVFKKFVNNIRLHGGKVTVFEEADGSIAHVFDDSSEDLKLNFAKPAINSDAAMELVDELTANANGSTAELVWFRLNDELILAWEVTADLIDTGAAASPTGLETVVDASNGQVLSQRQLDSKTYQPGSPEILNGGAYPRIVINNAIGAAGSRAYAAPFDAVVEVAFGCSGTLIADNVVLCARHCGVGAGSTVIFGDNSNGGGDFQRTVQSSILPDGGGSLLDGGDVAILTLTQPVPANIATPMRLIDETNGLEGMLCATLGYGFNGLGSQGHGNSADGFRWGGENIIDVYGSPAASNGSNIISTDFDNGSAGANTIGSSSPTPVEFEATTAPGDSGGPVLVLVGTEWVIAGVLSGGTTNNSVFGDISWWTGTAVYRSQIENSGGEFVGATTVEISELPDFISTLGGDTLDVDVVSEMDSVVPGSGMLHVDTGSGFQETPLIVNSPTSYTAVFPATECLTSVRFYMSFELSSGATITEPSNAPAEALTVTSADGFLLEFSDSFDTNTGWTVSGNATDGQWQRGIPNNGDRGDPVADAESTGNGLCYVTDNGNTNANDNTDVDGGSTILTSPTLNASGAADEIAFLSYFRWYSNDFGAGANADIFVVEISNNGGATWVNLETVGPAGPGTSGGWVVVEHRIEDFVTPTNNMRVRFTASDLGEGSVIEAGVDAVSIKQLACSADVMHGDVNLDGVVNLLDVQGFVNLISNGEFQAEADVNKDGVVNLLDVEPFIDLIGG